MQIDYVTFVFELSFTAYIKKKTFDINNSKSSKNKNYLIISKITTRTYNSWYKHKYTHVVGTNDVHIFTRTMYSITVIQH